MGEGGSPFCRHREAACEVYAGIIVVPVSSWTRWIDRVDSQLSREPKIVKIERLVSEVLSLIDLSRSEWIQCVRAQTLGNQASFRGTCWG